jgi:mannan endo-1,4-beta-mannosidase
MTRPPGPATPVPNRLQPPGPSFGGRARTVAIYLCAVILAALVTVGIIKTLHRSVNPVRPPVTSGSGTIPIGTFSHHPVRITLPATVESYLGVFAKGVPASYTPVKSFARAADVHVNVALYYSGWNEKFQSAFAIQAAENGAVPFIQIDPARVKFTAIIDGAYDTYLKTFATQVAGYGKNTRHGVIIGFGHEMNGRWSPWGYGHVPSRLFVAAWRHVVTIFRQQGADDVTWLWTVNVVAKKAGIPPPNPWWPGRRYVTWIGIDGYYFKRSWTFASLFGRTVKDLIPLARVPIPILISETGAAPGARKAAKITNLFTGVRNYGLLGLVWFDAGRVQSSRLSTSKQFAAFHRGALAFKEYVP